MFGLTNNAAVGVGGGAQLPPMRHPGSLLYRLSSSSSRCHRSCQALAPLCVAASVGTWPWLNLSVFVSVSVCLSVFLCLRL